MSNSSDHFAPRTSNSCLRDVALETSSARADKCIATLRELGCFQELVRRFIYGQSVSEVARWLHNAKLPGALSNGSYRTVRAYLTPLRTRVRAHVRESNLHHTEASVQDVSQALNEDVGRPNPVDDIRKTIDREMQSVDALTMLKYEWFILLDRIRPMLETEAKSGSMNPLLNREFDRLRIIAVAIGRLEIGATIMRDRATYRAFTARNGTARSWVDNEIRKNSRSR
jgi:hypothetical protein